jgi:fructosamine-3-kinase
MIPTSLQRAVETNLSDFTQSQMQIFNSTPVGGGCIHQAQKLQTNRGDFFLKYNHQGELPNFLAEKAGLEQLQSVAALPVPTPIFAGQSSEHAFLLMEFINGAPQKQGFWTQFGEQLAALHRNTRTRYGWDHDNFIGRLPQKNDKRDSWLDFFVEMRLEPQLVLAEQNGYADAGLRKQFETLYQKLPDLIPDEPASLLHGDLWSGNFLTGAAGEAVIVDPAVYYGHREMEIAFTRLFGGFAPEFYAAYNSAWPLQNGWETRIDLMNLYPLTVHLNLFGHSYLPEIQSVLRKFT